MTSRRGRLALPPPSDPLLVSPERSLQDAQRLFHSGLLLHPLGEAQHAEHQSLVPLTPVQGGIDVPAPRAVEPTGWKVRRAALVARSTVSSSHLGRGHDRDSTKGPGLQHPPLGRSGRPRCLLPFIRPALRLWGGRPRPQADATRSTPAVISRLDARGRIDMPDQLWDRDGVVRSAQVSVNFWSGSAWLSAVCVVQAPVTGAAGPRPGMQHHPQQRPQST